VPVGTPLAAGVTVAVNVRFVLDSRRPVVVLAVVTVNTPFVGAMV